MTDTNNQELFDAINKNDLSLVRKLVEQGTDINAKDGNSYTPFLSAMLEGHLEICEYLLKQGACAQTINSYYGDSAMHYGVNSIDALEIAFREKVPIDAKNSDGDTPLMTAAQESTIEIMQWLLDHGADVNAQNNGGWTCLHMAYAFRPEYDEACPNVAFLLKQGADPAIKDKQGRLPEEYPVGP